MKESEPKKGWEGRWEPWNSNPRSFVPLEAAAAAAEKGGFQPKSQLGFARRGGDLLGIDFLGGKVEFWGRYRFVLLGQVWEGEGRLRIHEVVGDVPERGHQHQLAASTEGGKNERILG